MQDNKANKEKISYIPLVFSAVFAVTAVVLLSAYIVSPNPILLGMMSAFLVASVLSVSAAFMIHFLNKSNTQYKAKLTNKDKIKVGGWFAFALSAMTAVAMFSVSAFAQIPALSVVGGVFLFLAFIAIRVAIAMNQPRHKVDVKTVDPQDSTHIDSAHHSMPVRPASGAFIAVEEADLSKESKRNTDPRSS